MTPCLDLSRQVTWTHHRCGWAYAVKSLAPLHVDGGVRFVGFLDRILGHELIGRPFVGVLHNPLSAPADGGDKYAKFSKCQYYTFNSKAWAKNEEWCLGLLTLSQHLARVVGDFTQVSCEAVTHPVEMCDLKFSMDAYRSADRVVHLGQWMRRYDSFYRLRCRQRKLLLEVPNAKTPPAPSPIAVSGWVPHERLDAILSNSVVFSHFFDVAACNGVLDCIARNTPILTNRLPATEEYLGKDYPFFFDWLPEAEEKLADDALVEQAHLYLKRMDKSRFSGSRFLADVSASRCVSALRRRTLRMP